MADLVTKLEKILGSKDIYIPQCRTGWMFGHVINLHAIFVCLNVLTYIYISIYCAQMHKKAYAFMYSCTYLPW